MTALDSTTLALANPGTHLPGYARENVTVGMIHIGVGGFHRAHQAVYLDALLSEDESARSCRICGVSLLPQDRRVVEVMNAARRAGHRPGTSSRRNPPDPDHWIDRRP
jgi:mannitol 2-dehydrogenase